MPCNVSAGSYVTDPHIFLVQFSHTFQLKVLSQQLHLSRIAKWFQNDCCTWWGWFIICSLLCPLPRWILVILLEALGFLMPLRATDATHLMGATIAGIAHFILPCSSFMQVHFTFLAFLCSVPIDFAAVPALSTECTITFNIREINHHLMPMPIIPILVSLRISGTWLHSKLNLGMLDFS